VILKIHELILNGINDAEKGKYRDVRVRIAGSNAVLPNPLRVPDLMNNVCKILDFREDTIMKAIEAHYKLVEIHPFIDGNGRTARLLMALILLRANVIPIIIQPRERKRYLDSINKRNVNGYTFQYYKYMLKQLLRTTEIFKTLFYCDKKVDETDKLLKISEFAKLCEVPISTIRYYLRTQRLTPIARTNAGYMLFSEEQKELLGAGK
jgi:Fic family protein